MRTAIKEVYKFSELADDVKEKVINKNRDINTDYEWWDFAFDDYKTIGSILGIEITNIYFSGFSSQGDGACFEGSYSYGKESRKKIREYAPLDEELHKIADNLFDIQRRNFYILAADIKHRGHYSHEMCTDINVYPKCGGWNSEEVDEGVKEFLRDFMRWIYRSLEKEYEYLTSDEQIIESLEINETEYTEDGHIWR